MKCCHKDSFVYESSIIVFVEEKCHIKIKSVLRITMTTQCIIEQILDVLTHWGWVTHICVTKLTIIASDNGLSPGRRQAIIWTNAGILLTGALRTNISEILIKIYTFSLKKMHLKMSSGKRRPSCFCLNVLKLACLAIICPPFCLNTINTTTLSEINSHCTDIGKRGAEQEKMDSIYMEATWSVMDDEPH